MLTDGDDIRLVAAIETAFFGHLLLHRLCKIADASVALRVAQRTVDLSETEDIKHDNDRRELIFV